MSAQGKTEKNIELVSAIYEAVRNGDFEAFSANMSTDVTLIEADSMIVGGTYTGVQEVLGCLGKLASHFDWSSLRVLTILGGPSEVVAEVSVETSGPQKITLKVSEWWTLEDGKISEVRPYHHDTEMLNGLMRENAGTAEA